jgi:hypothetical protein
VNKPSPVSSIILLLGALILLYCAFGTGWFSLGDEGGIGLIRMKQCYDGECRSKLIFDKHMHVEDMLLIVTFLMTFATAVVSAIAGLVLFKPGRSALALVAVIGAGVAMASAVALLVKIHGFGITYGPAFYLFWLSTIGVLVAGILAMQRPAIAGQMPMGYPSQPMGYPGLPPMGYPGQPPMGGPVASAPVMPVAAMPPPGPPCTTCGTPTTFVAQYNKQFCQRCNRYLV